MKPSFVVFALITLALLSYGLYQGMVVAPTERTMGEVQRIFYYHLPSAWIAFTLFLVNFLASLLYLAKANRAAERVCDVAFAVIGLAGIAIMAAGKQRIENASAIGGTLLIAVIGYFLIRKFFSRMEVDWLAVSSAEVGVVFCTIVLITGPLWARPVWGIWWTWDARLTSTLVLWLIYVSYLILRKYSSGGQTPVIAAALAIFGFVDVPLVYMSIRWFRTQHPQPVIGGGEGSGLDAHMWIAVLWNLIAFAAFATMVVWLRYKLAKAEHEVESAYATRALAHDVRGAR